MDKLIEIELTYFKSSLELSLVHFNRSIKALDRQLRVSSDYKMI